MVFVVILFLGLFMLSMSVNEYIDPRSRLDPDGGLNMARLLTKQPARAEAERGDVLTVENLNATM